MFRHDHFHFSSGDAGHSQPLVPLAQQLHAARDALNQEQPPPHVLPQLLAAFDQQRQLAHATRTLPTRFERCRAWLAHLSPLHAGGPGNGPRSRLATACLLAMAVGLIVLMQPGPALAPPDALQQAQANAGFVPLVPASRMAGNAAAWLVPTELSHANLASLGAPFDPSRANETVHAELLVNARGDVLAVRFP